MTIYIKNGRVIDPANRFDALAGLFIKDGLISPVTSGAKNADITIDAEGCWVTPGFIDLHAHLREPGFEYKETIATGVEAAAAGGFCAVCAMPNTNPVADSPAVLSYIKKEAEKYNLSRVLPICSVTVGQRGKTLCDYAALKGAVAISEDGKSVQDDDIMQQAFFAAKVAGLPVFSHCERESLVNGGVLNAGSAAERLGLPGITNETEENIIARDIELAKKARARLHICHVTTAGGVELVRDAQKSGAAVTCEVCPHHFTLTDDDIDGDDANFKMAPPLRSKADRAALIEGLRDGAVSAIATDHAPHSAEDKAGGFLNATNGVIGLETALPLAVTELSGVLTPLELVEKLSLNPARILGINGGALSPGSVADVTIIDPTEVYTIDVSRFRSKSKNSPFNGRNVKGRVLYTIISGRVAYDYRQTYR
jgi:dihydroorotase